jgi:alpha-L-rhamnosidase
MTSFNHYALGAVADWLHRTVGGLAPAEPGYRRLEIRPRPGGGLTHAAARHRTPYGLAESAWRLAGGRFELEVLIPPNTSALVTLPGSEPAPVEVGSGRHRWSCRIVDATSPRLTLDSTLSELVGDAEAWSTAVRYAPELAGQEVGLQGRGEMKLAQALRFLPNPEATRAALEAALTALGRAGGPETQPTRSPLRGGDVDG